jgi:hypothetical protein
VEQMEKHGTKTDEFLLAEYRYIGDSFWRNEETGEKRVTYYITLATAVISALVALTTHDLGSPTALYAIAFFALFSLLAFGAIMLLRMIHRNRVSDDYKRAMDAVRQLFRNEDDRLREYKPFLKPMGRKVGTGGLVDVLSLVNSLVVTALFALTCWILQSPLVLVVFGGVIGFLLAWFVQMAYVQYRYNQ